jgi:hypothetical protein
MDLWSLKRYKYLIAILLFAVISRIIWLKLTLNADEGELGYDAMLWLRGELPYTTRLSEKPPLAYLIYMAFVSLFGNTIIPVRIFNDTLFVISIIALYFLVESWYGKSTSLVASFLYAFFLSAPVFWGPYATAIQMSMPLTILSILLCNKYVETGRTASLIASGLLLSMAGLIGLESFPTALVLLVILVLGCKGRQKSGIKSSGRFLDTLAGSISVLMTGILLPILFTAIFFSATGVINRVIYNILVRPVTQVAPVLASYSFPASFPLGWVLLGLTEALPLLVLTCLGGLAYDFSRGSHSVHVITWLLAPIPFLLALEPHDPYHFSVLIPAASILSAIAICSFLKGVPRELFEGRRRRKLSRNRIRKILIFSFLILLFLPSSLFQALQFPSGSIHWEFINCEYSTVGSYDQVVELANYLKSLNVTDGKVLVQDWLPYVYWFTGIKAPTIYLDSVQIGLGIPLEAYEKLFTQVKQKAIPYVVVISNRPEGTDNITDFVRSQYFLLKRIGNTDVYGASQKIAS